MKTIDDLNGFFEIKTYLQNNYNYKEFEKHYNKVLQIYDVTTEKIHKDVGPLDAYFEGIKEAKNYLKSLEKNGKK